MEVLGPVPTLNTIVLCYPFTSLPLVCSDSHSHLSFSVALCFSFTSLFLCRVLLSFHLAHVSFITFSTLSPHF
ncbi:hypothetical protein K457DRAFT_141702 [Linnemannia elongata AG-77]|uniref:Uncharacterized protein n=1 Tax=Linnemannia elongata AG-77 TaxID=1314771 RepID=A0A197JJU7_9FUNG|nr:hypothetical protein K457DRAFT_141702 [Linnemannia elongata AG-77]